jgi:predicted nucleic acid-binding protein
MRVLFDTNIIIYREDHTVLPTSLQNLHKALNQSKVEILVHPKSLEDIKRDSDEERINDEIDNAILYAVYRNAVDLLITEDKGVHKKAIRLEIKDRVLSIAEALEIFEIRLRDEKIIVPNAMKEDFVYNLNIKDPFFNSLKTDYNGIKFREWFERISKKGRKCFVHRRPDGSIGALLIYKEENEPIDSDPVIPAKRRLKLCTFKVSYVGNKIGELFIKLAVEVCKKYGINEMYLTLFPKKQDYLVDLIKEHGFKEVSKLNGTNEVVYLKHLTVEEKTDSVKPVDISRDYYPTFYDGSNVNKFIIPIRPKWHIRLFNDYNGKKAESRQLTLIEASGEFIVEGNTITKAYLCNVKRNELREGSLVLFYRSEDEKCITSVGVVERVEQELQNKEEIIRLVGKRTVYSIEEIEQLAKKPTTVILFKWHLYLKNPLTLKELINMGALKGAPQTITQISHEQYLMIKTRGLIDERYTAN